MKGSKLWMAVIMVLILGSYSAVPMTTKGSTSTGLLKDVPAATSTDHITGPENASITFIEYSDYQCPFCATFDTTMNEILETFPNDVRLVYRDFPLNNHKNAVPAAKAAHAAAKQGKFWEMHSLIFKTQNDWSNISQAEAFNKFLAFSNELGMNAEDFTNDFANSEDAVQKSYEESVSLKIPGTPTHFMNGVQINPPTDRDSFQLF